MKESRIFTLPVATAVLLLATLNLIIFGVALLAAPIPLSIQYIPDDGYYYLTLARNFANQGVWTFDSGVSVTSGFHPLFAYLLVGLYTLLQPTADAFVIYSLILSLAFTFIPIFILWRWGVQHQNIFFLLFLALILTSENVVYNAFSITEWSLTWGIAALYVVAFFRAYANPHFKRSGLLLLFALGVCGSLARSDFGLLPFALTAAAFAFYQITPKSHLQLPIWGLAGAVFGVALGFAHNWLLTGELLQSSAKMKSYWAQLSGTDYYSVPVLVNALLGVGGMLLLVWLTAVALRPRFTRPATPNQSPPSFQPTPLVMLLASLICLVGYTFVYARNGAFQFWYTSNLVMPVLLLIWAVEESLWADLPHKAKQLFGGLFVLFIGLNLINLYPLQQERTPWSHQQVAWEAGTYLAEQELECHVGSWNAGIIGYYAGGNVVNLDGLVNNDIYGYAIRNELPAYMANHDICYIMDFANLIEVDFFRERGGYEDPDFINRLEPQVVFDEGQYLWQFLTLYQVREE
jgi:hypothetical protein